MYVTKNHAVKIVFNFVLALLFLICSNANAQQEGPDDSALIGGYSSDVPVPEIDDVETAETDDPPLPEIVPIEVPVTEPNIPVEIETIDMSTMPEVGDYPSACDPFDTAADDLSMRIVSLETEIILLQSYIDYLTAMLVGASSCSLTGVLSDDPALACADDADSINSQIADASTDLNGKSEQLNNALANVGDTGFRCSRAPNMIGD